MLENNEPSSDTSSDLAWPVDATIENHQHDRIVFENVADQYVKGQDIVVQFTILREVNVNEEEDQIGLIRIGTINLKKCLAYANVQFNAPSSGSIRHGTATFSSADLPKTDDEFYQFCYLLNKTKNLGSSIPFQLNCEADDINLLSTSADARAKADSLFALNDNDDDLVVIHTKRMLTEEKLRQENRQLSEMNRRLETEKDECQTKLEVFEIKRKDQIAKLNGEIQTLIAARKVVFDELAARQESDGLLRSEYEACLAQCDQYKNQAAEEKNRCREFEENNGQILAEINQIRNQLAATSQFTKDQATQIIDLERRLSQASDLTKTANQRNTLLEQQIRELRMTSEKQQLSMEVQINELTRLIEQREDQIRALQETNQLCKEELNTMTLEKQELIENAERDKVLIQQLQQEVEDCRENYQKENEIMKQELDQLQEQLVEKNDTETALQQSIHEIQKRCVKHQKSEVEAKRQLASYQDMIRDLEHQIQDLKDRLASGAEEYRSLFRKYTVLEQSKTNSLEIQQNIPEQLLPTTTVAAPVAAAATDVEPEDHHEEEELDFVLNNSTTPKNNDEKRSFSLEERTSMVNIDIEVQTCPVCNWDFPKSLALEGKRQHIEEHFEQQ